MVATEIAYVPTRMALEVHPAIDYEVYLLLQRRGAADHWACVRQSELAHALNKSLSSIRRALRRLAEGGYLVIRHRVVLGGRLCATAYRVLYGEGVHEWLLGRAGDEEQPVQRH